MGNRYTISRSAHTPVATQDSLTIISAANRRVRIVSLRGSGNGASSASQRFQIGRSTGGTTPGGAIVASKTGHAEEPAAVFTTATTWAAQPTLETNVEEVGWNALGGPVQWLTPPGAPQGSFEARNGENISIRAPTGPTYQACSFSVVVEED